MFPNPYLCYPFLATPFHPLLPDYYSSPPLLPLQPLVKSDLMVKEEHIEPSDSLQCFPSSPLQK